MRGKLMKCNTPSTTTCLKTLEEQRDALEAEIERIRAKESSDKCKPLCDELLSLQPQLEAMGAWPCAVIIDFHFGNTWLHANEAQLFFDEQLSLYQQSSSGWGGSSSRYSMPSVLGSKRQDPEAEAYYWNNYFNGERGLHIPTTKEALCLFKPFQREKCRAYQKQHVGRVFFYEQVIFCPICGTLHRDTKESGVKIKYSEYGNDWQWPHKLRADHYKIETLLSSAKAILSRELFDSGAVFRRCRKCAGQSFLDKWNALYKQAKDTLRFEEREHCKQLQSHIEAIWPDKFGAKRQIKTSIFRQAKKRARIKPLSRGELAFFTMHLAASQIKELKATRTTHDTNKILNQAN
jgi:hypothetical protein